MSRKHISTALFIECADHARGKTRTDSELHSYIKENYIPAASDSDIDSVLQAYPADPSQGSPFDSGSHYNITAQYKRLAAFQGDLIFQAPRRFFLNATAAKQPTWAFRASCLLPVRCLSQNAST